MSNKLSPEIKEKWIEALRSGEYKQGKYELYNSLHDSFCCLGVLEVICGTHKENIDRISTPLDLGSYRKSPSLDKVVPGTDSSYLSTLIGMNDHLSKSFPEIADWVEENM